MLDAPQPLPGTDGLVEGGIVCFGCGYSLKDLPVDAVCPECGLKIPRPETRIVCLGCGYSLKDLPVDAVCPECGLTIERSTANVVCLGCGYSLRDLPLDGMCPECGDEIARSTAASTLHRLQPGQLARMIGGIDLMLLAAGLVMIALPLAVWASHWIVPLEVTVLTLAIAAELCLVFGARRFARLRAQPGSDPLAGRRNSLLEWLSGLVVMICIAAPTVAAAVITALGGNPTYLWLLLLAAASVVSLINLFMLLGVGSQLALLVAGLAQQLPSPPLRRLASTAAWAVPMGSIIGFCVGGPVLSVLLLAVLLVWLRVRLRGLIRATAHASDR